MSKYSSIEDGGHTAETQRRWSGRKVAAIVMLLTVGVTAAVYTGRGHAAPSTASANYEVKFPEKVHWDAMKAQEKETSQFMKNLEEIGGDAPHHRRQAEASAKHGKKKRRRRATGAAAAVQARRATGAGAAVAAVAAVQANLKCPGSPNFKCPQATQAACPGDTRGTQGEVYCNHDATHRVCAEIGDPATSFWDFTGQQKWCGKDIYGNGQTACPLAAPSWCICKWATASWIKGEWPTEGAGGTEGNIHHNHPHCPDTIKILCAATDICNTAQGLFFSYDDFGTDLGPAHSCVKQKCANIWSDCEAANPQV